MPTTLSSNVSLFNPSGLHEIPVTTYSKVVAISPTSSSSLRTSYILPTQNVNMETSIWLKKKFTVLIIAKGENIEYIPSEVRKKIKLSVITNSIQHHAEVIARTVRQE